MSRTPERLSPWQAVLLVTIAVFAVGIYFPDIALPWVPFSTFGFDANVNGRIAQTVPNGAADNAGIRVGDEIDRSATGLASRIYIGVFSGAPRGANATFVVRRGQTERAITIVAQPRPRSLADNVTDVILCLTWFAFVTIAVVLVFLRPSRMTWAFFFYSIGSIAPSILLLYSLPFAPRIFLALYSAFTPSAIAVPFIIFALRFPSGTVHGWRRMLDAWLPLALVPMLLLAAYYIVGNLFEAPFTAAAATTLAYIAIAGYIVALCIFVDTYVQSPDERPRIRWVIFGFLLGYAGVVFLTISDFFPAFGLAPPLWITNILFSLNLAIPITVAYAVVKNRVIGVSFALNRTLVIAGATALLALGVALVQIVISTQFGRTTLGYFVEALMAVAIGLCMFPLYRVVRFLVERYVFAQHYLARKELSRLAAGLPYAESPEIIARTLTHGVCALLSLNAAAVYRRMEEGAFRRDDAEGPDAQTPLDAEVRDRLVLSFQGESAMVHLLGSDAIGFPIFIRRELAGFALFWHHLNGAGLDPDETALLARVVEAASRGYDALELASRVKVAYEESARAQVQSLENLQRFNEAYSRFVPSEFLHFLEKRSILDVALGDHALHRMTVLFADIRSFTTIAEGMSPEEVFAFLNQYLRHIGPLIRENGGFIDKYIGDAVMGLFPTRADDALTAAIALQREVRLLNARLAIDGAPPIAVGVGLHTGTLMLGTIGERGRMETTVISDAVNTASRLEGATKPYGSMVILSRKTVEALLEPERFMLRFLGTLRVRGRTEGVDAYESFDGDPPELSLHKHSTSARFAAAVETFGRGAIDVALNEFAAIAGQNPLDGAAAFYLRQCRETVERGRPSWR